MNPRSWKNRRRLSAPIFLAAGIAAALATCALAATPIGRDEDPRSGKPNIVFILVDDLGYGDLSCFGQKNFKTPCLDRMADGGMRLTDHYAGATVCAPSRACLLTGQHTGHVFQRFNGPIEFRPDPLDVTVATRLQEAGYHTAMIGKSGLSCNSDNGSLPNEKGFDHFFGFTSHGVAHRHYPEWLWRNGQKIDFPENHRFEGSRYDGDLFMEEALAYLDAHRAGPFFLHLALTQPHPDLNVPAAWRERFLTRFDDQATGGGGYRPETHPKATFAGMVAFLDDAVGRILAKLKDLGIENDTLVIFTSDNGAMSEGGWSEESFNSSGPLRGGKRDLYEGGIRVPTIVSWPGHVAAGQVCRHMCAFWDFMPTACELAGVAPPADTDGISYVPALLGKEQQQHEFLYWEFYEQNGKQAVRLGKWKGVRLNVADDADGPLEIYDLNADLGETKNVAAEHPDLAEKMARLMSEAHRPSEVISFSAPAPR